MSTKTKLPRDVPYNYKKDPFFKLLLENDIKPILFHVDFLEDGDRIDKPPCYKIKSLTVDNYEEEIEKNWERRKPMNLALNPGIACKTGQETGFIVLDIDTDFMAKWEEIVEKYDEPDTLKVQSQSGAIHYYFKYDKKLPELLNRTNNQIITLNSKPQAIDIRGNGGYIVTPIRHNYTCKYSVLNETTINSYPKWLIDYIDEHKTLKNDAKTKYIPNTTGDDDLNYLKFILLSNEREHSETFVKKYSNIIKVVDEVEDIVYVWSEETCLWEQKRGDPFILNMIVEHFSELFEIFLKNYKFPVDDPKQKEKFMRAQKSVLRMSYAKGVYAKSKTALYDENFLEKIDSISELLPIKNNLVINLKTCTTRQRTRDDMFSFQCPVKLLGKNKIKPVIDILLKIMNNDIDMLSYLQHVCGYLLTGENSYRAWFLFYGEGCNGKGMLAESIQKILVKEKFFSVGAAEIFLKQDKRKIGAHPELMHIEKKRVVNFAETEEGEALNESLIKSISGGDTITGRNLYKKPHEFMPVCKLVIQTNHLPKFNPDPSMIDRFFPIPFNARFADDPKEGEFLRDPDLKSKFMTEYLDMFFSWCCFGSKNWYDTKKIIVPETAKKAKRAYINVMDNVTQFIKDRFALNEEYKVSSGSLYNEYKTWCVAEGFKCVTIIKMHEVFKKKFGDKKKYNGNYFYHGLQFDKTNGGLIVDMNEKD